jgi:hypothetical protein
MAMPRRGIGERRPTGGRRDKEEIRQVCEREGRNFKRNRKKKNKKDEHSKHFILLDYW